MTSLKSSILLSTYNAVHIFSPTAPTCSTSLRALSPRDHRCHKTPPPKAPRSYATITGDSASNDIPGIPWPEPPKGHTHPTPYQIFDLPRTAPYTKARFYQLVKIYHPDRSTGATCTQNLERYRLIVAAHTILSDPSKRRAYDAYGAGWNGKADLHPPSTTHTSNPGPFSSWRTHADPIFANATWEDWERWRHNRDGNTQSQSGPVYMSNSAFISMVLVLAAVGSSWNYNRADQAGESFLASRDAIHDRAAKELRRVRQETGLRAKEERIEYFLRNREATALGVGVQEVREERARQVLGTPRGHLGELEEGKE
ncbi:hypothetical protein MBLNU457_3155t1 [Dothideomycetes sp. NU457]